MCTITKAVDTRQNFFVVYNGILKGKPMKEQRSVQSISADDWEFADVVTVNGQDFKR